MTTPRSPRAARPTPTPRAQTVTQKQPARLPRRHDEADFQSQVIQYARINRWRVFHAFDSRLGSRAIDAGFPDLVMVKDGHLLVCELKANNGRVKPEQTDWLMALQECGIRVRIWRPRDWNEIERVLTTYESEASA